MKIPKNKTLLIDGDILLYRCAFVAEKTHYLVQFPNGEFGPCDSHRLAKAAAGEEGTIWSRKEIKPVEFAYNAINTTLDSFVGIFDPKDVRVYLSDTTNFRERIAVTRKYKGNRDSTSKPHHYKDCREFLLNKGAIIRGGLEADDLIGIELTRLGADAIALTIDKDLDQVPGLHYNWVDDELYNVTPRQGDVSLWTQVITGDFIDNVPGLPGVGRVNAEKILAGAKSSKDLFNRTLAAYLEAGKTKEYLLEQIQLVYILRKENDYYALPEEEKERLAADGEAETPSLALQA